jgi:hypothetical protein
VLVVAERTDERSETEATEALDDGGPAEKAAVTLDGIGGAFLGTYGSEVVSIEEPDSDCGGGGGGLRRIPPGRGQSNGGADEVVDKFSKDSSRLSPSNSRPSLGSAKV